MADQRTVGARQRRSAARTVVVWEALQRLLGDRQLSVLDIGGGTGGFAVRAAELGNRVTVVDPSPDALATLARRAAESGVADRVTGRQGDLDSLTDLVPDGSVDVVLCHGVLEIVDDPAAALAAIATTLHPDGSLSLLVNQRHAAVFTRAMAGHFGEARALLEPDRTTADGSAKGEGSSRRFTAEEIIALLAGAGFATTEMHAVRVFVDHVPSSLVDLEAGAADRLVELEQAVADRPEYLPLATQIHVVATRR